jgi:hypothetical protein
MSKKNSDFVAPEQLAALMEGIDGRMQLIQLVKGNVAGKSYWAYAIIKPSRFLAFQEAVSKGAFNLGDYAEEIIAQGQGDEPLAEVKRKIEKKYEADHTFEDKILQTVESAIKQAK